jgi:putative ABC transport system permease protein
MRAFFGDLRFGLRGLLRAPGFAVAAVLALGLGIGATAAIFSVVNGVVLRPLPYSDPARLVTIWDTNHEKALEHEPVSPVTFVDYRALGQVFTDAAAWWRPEVTLRGLDQEPQRVNTVEVSGNLLQVLGVSPILGAGFPADQFYSRDRMVLISERLWRARFGGAPDVIGRNVRLNDDDFMVAGVLPAGFHYPGDTDVWQRLTWDLARHSRGAHFMESVARLKPGATVAQAQREVDALTTRLGTEFVGTNKGWSARVIALHDDVVGKVRPALLVLLAAVVLLLLIACINVATLLLARSASRARELAVRAAIGASRARLLRQLLTESLLLAAVGGIVGVAIAAGAVRGIVAATPVDVPRLAQVSLDGRVLALAVALVVGTAVVFGLLPGLLMARVDPQGALKEGGRTQGAVRARGRMHRVLVVSEIAIAVVLLAGAGLMVRSVSRLSGLDPGFRPDGIVTADVQLNGAAYAQWPAVAQFYASLVDRLKEQPGVTAAGTTEFLPLSPGWRIPFLIRGLAPPARGDEPMAQYHSVSDGYLETLGVSLIAGRVFDAHDTAASQGVVVINESLARRYFSGVDPVGRTIASLTTNIGPLGASLMSSRDHVVIGVVGDVRNSALGAPAEPALYHTFRQFPFRHVFIAVRGEPDQAAAAIRSAVRSASPDLPPVELRTMPSVLGEMVVRPRFLLYMLSVFAASALALASLGVYGLLSYAVVERRQELSIRMALGAGPGGVIWMILRQGMTLALMGCAAGLLVAWLAARGLSGFLFGVPPGDPATMSGVALAALAIAVLACAIPAFRAARVNVLDGLRN